MVAIVILVVYVRYLNYVAIVTRAFYSDLQKSPCDFLHLSPI